MTGLFSINLYLHTMPWHQRIYDARFHEVDFVTQSDSVLYVLCPAS